QELMRSALIASALILLLAALVGISISRRTLTRPIQSLVKATRAIAEGNFDQRIAIQRNDELGELATSFKGMIASLSSSREEVERSRRRFRDFAGSSSDWLWETDRNGRFLFVSETVR